MTVKVQVVAVGCAAFFAVRGANVTLTASNPYGNGDTGFADTTCWSDGVAAKAGNDYWIITTDKFLTSKSGNRGNESFPGNSLNVGSPSSSSYGFTSGKLNLTTIATSTMTLPNLIWWSGMVNTGWGGTHLWYGTWTVRQVDSGAYHRTGLNSDAHCYTNFVTLVSSDVDPNAANAIIELGVGNSGSYPGGITYNTMSIGTKAYHHFRGNFSAYKGAIKVAAPYQPVVIFNGTIIGDVSVPNAQAIQLGNNACFAIGANFEQNTSRGIYIYGTQAYFMTWNIVANDWTLSYPVSGQGKVVKDGPGKVTLACAWTAGDITVAAGTLELSRSATFPIGQKVTVKSGATLIIRRADCWTGFDVTVENGGNVVHYPIVGYDAAQGLVTEPVSIPANEAFNQSNPLRLALSSAIAVPFHAEKRLAVATIASGARTYTAADFMDLSDKTYGLPNTTFDVIREVGGEQTIFLVAKPVVTSVQAFTDYDKCSVNGHNTNVGTNYWSDNARAHSGADYLLRHDVYTMGNEDFAGDSLVLAGTMINTRTLTNTLTKVSVRSNSRIQPNHGSYHVHNICGNISIDGTYTEAEDYLLTIRGIIGSSGRSQEGVNLLGNLTGDGAINVLAANVFTPPIEHTFSGDNSGFVGRIRLGMSTNGGAANRLSTCRLRFASPESLGGPLDRFRYSAITVTGGCMLVPERSMTLDTANRGIYITTGGFDVPDGVVLTVKEQIRQNGYLYKLGNGTLALGGSFVFGEQGTSASKEFYVEQGAISAVNDAAVRNMKLIMSNDTAIVLRPSIAVTNGIMGSLSIPDGQVRVLLDNCSLPQEPTQIVAPICTIPASLGDLTSRFNIVRPEGYDTTLDRMSITVGGVEHTRYSVIYRPVGCVIILR